MTEVEILRRENLLLKERLAALEAQLSFLANHRTLAADLAGEVLVSQHVDGALTAYAAGHDVVTATGQRIEVKKAADRARQGLRRAPLAVAEGLRPIRRQGLRLSPARRRRR